MKKLILLMVLIPFVASCQHDKAISAAEDFYLQYADRKDLTVALLAGYKKGNTTLNVVKLQAQNDAAWEQLLQEFNVRLSTSDSLSAIALGQNADKVTAYSKSASRVVVNGDTLVDDIDMSAESLASLFGTMLREAVGTDSVVSMTAVTSQKRYEKGRLVYDQTDTVKGRTGAMSDDNAMMTAAKSYGNNGYGLLTDDSRQTLWVLFYNTVEEMFAMIFNITNNL